MIDSLAGDVLSGLQGILNLIAGLARGEESAEASLLQAVSTLCTWIGIFVTIVIILIGLRGWLQTLFHILRIKTWREGIVVYEVVLEDLPGEDERVNATTVLNAASHLSAPKTRGGFFGFFHQTLRTVVIRLDPEYSAVRVFFIVRNTPSEVGPLKVWASILGYSLEKIEPDDDDFNIVYKGAMNAYLAGPAESNIKGVKDLSLSSLSSVIEGLQSFISDASRGSKDYASTIVLTYQAMSEVEGKMTTGYVALKSQKAVGNEFNSGHEVSKMKIFKDNNPARAAIAAFSDSGSNSTSRKNLDTALKGVSNLGFGTDIRKPNTMSQMASICGAGVAVAMGGLAYLGMIPYWIPAVALIFSIPSALSLPFVTTMPYQMAAQTGMLPVPPFVRYSPRRALSVIFQRRSKLEYDSRTEENQTRNVAPPSPAAVIPLYQYSLACFVTMPTSKSGSADVARTAIPQVAAQEAMWNASSRSAEAGDSIYLGLSAKTYQPIFRDRRDINFGVAYGGDPGSGKTNALLVDFAGMSLLSKKAMLSNEPGHITPIWIETKPEKVHEIHDMASRIFGEVKAVKGGKQISRRAIIIAAHNPKSPGRLCLEGPRLGDIITTVDDYGAPVKRKVNLKDVRKNAAMLLDGISAVFGDSFQAQSREITKHALHVAVYGRKEEFDILGISQFLGKDPNRANVLKTMALVTGKNETVRIEERLEELTNKLNFSLNTPQGRSNKNEELAHLSPDDRKEELGRLLALYDAASSLLALMRKRPAVNFAAPSNKLSQLSESEGMFECFTPSGTQRKEISLSTVISSGAPIVLDMTSAELGSDIGRNFTMLVHYMMWKTIEKIAPGWASAGRYTPIYTDEISNFTGARGESPQCDDLIAVVKDKGRSYGVSHNVGFQNFAQMSDVVRNAVMSYPSHVFFTTTGAADRTIAIESLGTSSRFSSDSLMHLPQGYGIAHLTLSNTRYSPFTLKFPHAESWASVLAAQGNNSFAAYEETAEFEEQTMKADKRKFISNRSSGSGSYSSNSYEPDDSYDAAVNDDYIDPDILYR